MKRGTLMVVAVSLCSLFLFGAVPVAIRPAWTAMDIFLKIDDIKGESTDSKHKDEIEVLSWTWGMERTGDTRYGSGGSAGIVSFHDLVVVKALDRATPRLFEAVTAGDHLKMATLTLRETGGSRLEVFKIVLENLLVTSLADSAASSWAETRPTETFGLNATKVTYFYTPDGTGVEQPRVTNPGPQTSVEGDTVSLQIHATAPFVDYITYSATGLPPGLSIDAATGLISGTIPFGSAGAYNVAIHATDPGGLQGSASFLWTVTHTNRGPSVEHPGDRMSLEGDTVALQIVASDPDNDPLTYAAAGLPSGLSIDPSSGLITGTIPAGGSGTYPVAVTVTDLFGIGANTTFTWTVTLGMPRISGAVVAKGWASPGVLYLDVTFRNAGTGHARNLVLKTAVPRALAGTGTVTFNASLSPVLPLALGDLNVGYSTTVRLYFNVPATVTRFSVTEGGPVQDVRGTLFNYSAGQAVIP